MTTKPPAKRLRKIPSRYKVAGLVLHDKKLMDVLPEPAPALAPPCVQSRASSPKHPQTDSALTENHPTSLGIRLCHVLQSTCNSFGLFRRYYAKSFPSHDPENKTTLSALSNIVDPEQSSDDPPSFCLYSNRSSFQLGDWYWNRGAQKSQQGCKSLVDIVGAEDFEPTDIRATSWSKINHQLSLNYWDKEDWVDNDAGRKTSDIKISVPFDRLTENPGVREYVAGSLHHRSLVNIIHNKISNPCTHAHFYYEPYELLWQPTTDHEEVRVQGELYTSPAFISAHNVLQECPVEPSCNLPCVVVALMFWSDATQLMNFGNAKLWPLYMFFGNKSKYRQCTCQGHTNTN